MTTERLGVVCSHCKEINFTNEEHYPVCHTCGHQADKPRYLCDCERCRNMRANVEAERRKADGANS